MHVYLVFRTQIQHLYKLPQQNQSRALILMGTHEKMKKKKKYSKTHLRYYGSFMIAEVSRKHSWKHVTRYLTLLISPFHSTILTEQKQQFSLQSHIKKKKVYLLLAKASMSLLLLSTFALMSTLHCYSLLTYARRLNYNLHNYQYVHTFHSEFLPFI